MKKIILFIIGLQLSYFAISQDIKGYWKGVLEFGQTKLPVNFNIAEVNDSLTATMDSPSQGAKGISVSAIVFENLKIKLSINAIGASYDGELRNDTIFGEFKQSGMSFLLNLWRTQAEIQDAKPQTPKPPYPYHIEDVQFKNIDAEINLAGTLTLPIDGSNFTAVVLVSGSGPQNRDEELLGHSPFLVLADYLTRNGVAVLRYDDRGVNKSGGNYKTATINDFATDAASAVVYLKTRNKINPKKIGVIGHSEGGSIAILLAGAPKSDLAFVVSMAGSAIRGDSLMCMQRYLIAKALNISDKQIAENEKLISLISCVIDTHSEEYILQNMDSLVTGILPDSLKQNVQAKAMVRQGMQQMISHEVKSLLQFDPAEALANIKCPVLAINGEKDLQVHADANLENIKKLVKSSVTVKKYPNLNHLFQHCVTGLPTEYGNIDETISPDVLQDIAEWIAIQ